MTKVCLSVSHKLHFFFSFFLLFLFSCPSELQINLKKWEYFRYLLRSVALSSQGLWRQHSTNTADTWTLQCHHLSVRAAAHGTRLRFAVGRPHGPVFIQGAVSENDHQAYSRFSARSGKCTTQLHCLRSPDHQTNAVGFFKQVQKFRTQGDLPPRH